MILIDNGRSYDLMLRGVPDFPDALEQRYEAATLRGADETPAFLEWWGTQCQRRGFSPPRRGGEDIVHVRRMLARHSLGDLKGLATVFLNNYAEPLEERRYAHHMRLFAARLRECQDILNRWVGAND